MEALRRKANTRHCNVAQAGWECRYKHRSERDSSRTNGTLRRHEPLQPQASALLLSTLRPR